MEIKNIFYTLAGVFTGGMAAAATVHYRDESKGKPSVLDKAKEAEKKLYEDGEKQALLLEKVKNDAEFAAKNN